MIYGYVRVSTTDQNSESQKNVISRYCVERKFHIDEWMELEISTRKSLLKRRVVELIERLKPEDVVISTELSRLSRSMRETHNVIHNIVEEKKARIICIKDSIDISPHNIHSIDNAVKISMFSLAAALERNAISERTREGLAVIKARGVKLGKPKGCIQKTIYDQDKERIFHLYSLGVNIPTILRMHLHYGSYNSLNCFIQKRKVLNQ
jgi:DNA invertase Pin-like site-specific DNA recombinase